MGRKSCGYKDRELEEGQNFECIIYPDSKEYNCDLLLNRLSSYWDEWLYILHDKDFYTEYDFDKAFKEKGVQPDFQVGEIKKPHYHVIGHVNSKCILGRAAKKFGVSSNQVQKISKYKSAIRYLIHLDNPEKFQYHVEEIKVSRIDFNLEKYLKANEMSATEKAKIIVDHILMDNCDSMTDLTIYAIQNYVYDELRRGQHLYSKILTERRIKK